jgi:hypothetical protein
LIDHTIQQDILYLQSSGTSLSDQVIGMSLVVNGEINEQNPQDPWPYQNVLEAIRDGWRVIQFPNLALVPDENRPTGLGCEFILEKLR